MQRFLQKYQGPFLILVLVVGLGLGYVIGYYTGLDSVPVSQTLLIDAAGTLQVPFNDIVKQVVAPQYSSLSYNYIFEGSRLAANEITLANKSFDIFASADYRIIPQQLIPAHASWYIIFASNAMSVIYTNHSRYANEINANNWYQIITRPGVILGASNKETDPSGSQAIFMLELAGLTYYQNSSYLYDQVYVTKAASKELIIVPTETTLDAQLETGAVDYILTYSSEAISHKLLYLNLDPKVNLSDLTMADWYAKANATIGGKPVTGAAVLYDITIPSNSPDSKMAVSFIQALFSQSGQAIMQKDGLKPLNPAYVYNQSAIPTPILQAITNAGIGIKEVT